MKYGHDASRAQAGSSAGRGSSGDNSFIGSLGNADARQGAASAGRWIGPELPVHDICGGHPFSEGFSPSSDGPHLPPPGSDVGAPMPPNGYRR